HLIFTHIGATPPSLSQTLTFKLFFSRSVSSQPFLSIAVFISLVLSFPFWSPGCAMVVRQWCGGGAVVMLWW
ncbi:hypothetical protein VIGAN_04015200, partial [Vigna angularis var. angularis]